MASRDVNAIEKWSRKVAWSLRQVDSDIQSVVLFGSGVYAPDLAQDLDLLILFDAARLAVMTFLNPEETRWGQLWRQLPNPWADRFRRIVEKLHGAYFYESSYPAEEMEEEYQRWHIKGEPVH